MHNEIHPQKNDIVSFATTQMELHLFSRNEANQAWETNTTRSPYACAGNTKENFLEQDSRMGKVGMNRALINGPRLQLNESKKYCAECDYR